MDNGIPGTPAADDHAADLATEATAARAALYPDTAASRAAQMEARFDAWLALAGGGAAGGGVGAGPLRLPMLSGSMHPALPRGCTLLIEPRAASRDGGAPSPQPGDVVVFARDGRLVAHRVLKRARRGGAPWLLEMGDANRRGDWRPLAEAVGVVVGAETADGSPLPPPASRARARRLLLRHWAGVVLGIAAPAGDALTGDAADARKTNAEPEGTDTP